MSKMPLTERQNLVLTTIDNFTRQNGYPPSVRDLMRAMDIKSPRGVQGHIIALRKKGWLKKVERGRFNYPARSLVIVPAGIQVGDRIQKLAGAPGEPATGVAVASFTSTAGEPLVVMEDDLGGFHIHHASHIERAE